MFVILAINITYLCNISNIYLSIQVRGLLPGQQLVQMPDGKLQIFSNPGGGSPGNDYMPRAIILFNESLQQSSLYLSLVFHFVYMAPKIFRLI